MKVLLITPPLVQWNTPYPATQHLVGYLNQLRTKHWPELRATQFDASIELVCRLFSKAGLEAVYRHLENLKPLKSKKDERLSYFLEAKQDYLRTVDAALRFLQGKDSSLAMRIAGRTILPEGPRFSELGNLEWAFGELGVQDKAKYLATLYFDDLSDLIKNHIDPCFAVTRYGEKLAASQDCYDALEVELARYRKAIQSPELLDPIDKILFEIAGDLVAENRPDVVGFTVPFPGNFLGALKLAVAMRSFDSKIKFIVGGGYPNTELRSLQDKRVLETIDFITLDDGEAPFTRVLEYLAGKKLKQDLHRTYFLDAGELRYADARLHDVPMAERGTPTYAGLDLSKYLSVLEVLNPMHRVWSDTRWNKIAVAHGCYWKKCSFCDVTLDYIGRYEPMKAVQTVDQMQAIAEETQCSGFHLVDEAAPPALLRGLSKEILARKKVFTWWGNIRFEKAFDRATTELMADAGCVAVSGGLEVASPRLLEKMNKGVTVEQVARVTRAFRESKILVHAYLMYGFPTQTVQETVDALERVRQLFAADCIQSAYWHRFSATAHSPIGKNPKDYGIEILPNKAEGSGKRFAENDLQFFDPTGVDHDRLGEGLSRAVYNYMHGIGLEEDVRVWFTDEVPKTKVLKSWIQKALSEKE